MGNVGQCAGHLWTANCLDCIERLGIRSALTAVIVIKGLMTAAGTPRAKTTWNAPSGGLGGGA